MISQGGSEVIFLYWNMVPLFKNHIKELFSLRSPQNQVAISALNSLYLIPLDIRRQKYVEQNRLTLDQLTTSAKKTYHALVSQDLKW